MKKFGFVLLFLLLAFAGCKNKGTSTTEEEGTMMESTESVDTASMEATGEMGGMEMSDTAAVEEVGEE